MTPEIVDLAVQIVTFVDDYQPGIVACEFLDAAGGHHTFIEKVPIVSLNDLDADSNYPQPGFARCIVLDRWCDDIGRPLARISTGRPDRIESSEGLSEFVVLQDQLSTAPKEP